MSAESLMSVGDALNDFSEAEARLRTLNDIVHRGNPATFIRKENKAPSSSHMAKFRLAQTHNSLPPKKVGLGVYMKQQKPVALAPLHASTSGSFDTNENAPFETHSTERIGFGHRLLSSAGDAKAVFSACDPSADDCVQVPLDAAAGATRRHPSSAKPSYRKRYLQMLRSMEMEARQKKDEEEQRLLNDERRRAKLREKVIGSEDVGSKFLSATVDA